MKSALASVYAQTRIHFFQALDDIPAVVIHIGTINEFISQAGIDALNETCCPVQVIAYLGTEMIAVEPDEVPRL